MSEQVLISQSEQGLLVRPDEMPLISIMSFAFSNGAPFEADIVMDVRFLNDPHDDLSLREKTGLDEDVGAYIKQDAGFEEFFYKFQNQIKRQFVRCAQEGKDMVIAVGCAGGQHRSVFTAESLRKWIESQGLFVQVNHRELP